MITENHEYSINELMPLISESISNGNSVCMRVRGMSMYPFLRDHRDTVVLSGPDNIQKYDIVLHRRSEGVYIMHRIIGKKGNVLTIAGDCEMQKEYPVYEDQVIAKVISFERNGKKVDCKSTGFKILSSLWLGVFPLRGIIISTWLKYRRIFNGKK